MKTVLLRTLLLLALVPGLLLAQGKKKRGPDGRIDLADELPADARRLALGDAAPDFKSAPVLMVVFLSIHCPYSHAAETRLIPFALELAPQGLTVVAINPNSPEGVDISELGYSKYSDSFEDMKLYARDQGFPFPYLYDGDTQATAKAYGCLATPHVFIFDRERKLRYVGHVDDSRFEGVSTVKSHDARNAVTQLLAGQPVTVPTTPVVGCSTKWNAKRGEIAKAAERRQAAPVELASIDAAGVAALAKNGSNRLRLVNVWATWCAPCVEEFPGLVALSHRLGNRDFEFVTISLDDPKLAARPKQFLEKQGAAPPNRLKRLLQAEGRTTPHFLYTEAGTDALVQALDPAWPGPLPHTVLIAPGGKVLYRHTGPVDLDELTAKIIGLLGAYYKP